ncbi:MAG TPA: nuclear transport factor 2 family protein [Gemmatimonadales bacterium]|nr:nuclear transport factor 2 family protein [Gemmatimonadales bacterium]
MVHFSAIEAPFFSARRRQQKLRCRAPGSQHAIQYPGVQDAGKEERDERSGSALEEEQIAKDTSGGFRTTSRQETMRTLTIAVACAAIAAAPASLLAQGIPDTIAPHLIALEQQWNDAILENDSAAAGAFMAAEWTEITSDGSVLTRSQDLAELVGGYHATSLRSFDFAVHVYDNVALISGVSEEQSSYKGKDTSGRFRWMDVWVRRAGRWVCVASTVARITTVVNDPGGGP